MTRLVDKTLTSVEQEAERQQLFGILEQLVKWENSNNADVLAETRVEVDRCFPDRLLPVLDPFAGGDSIPLEAQRLGLTALAGDLNPVAVLINKAMVDIPPRSLGGHWYISMLIGALPSGEERLITIIRSHNL